MAHEPIPNDPYRTNLSGDPRNPAQIDNDLQVDPELAEGSAGGGRIAMYAVAAAIILGAVLYGLNQTPTPPSTAQNSTQSSPPAAPPGMRDVTPRANTDQGVTTGAAPSQPPAASPPGSTVNPPANPVANPQAGK